MTKYADPKNAPACRCADQPALKAMFCPNGHMTECHYPLDCRTAACQHLDRYEEIQTQERRELDDDAEALVRLLADPRCSCCQGTGHITVETTFRIPEEFAQKLAVELPEDGLIRSQERAICRCVTRPKDTC
ncbi:MAG: hypothetical protein OXI74_05730 [Rhodospirillaceae bacterium]|nr:hypothetical protein [Rhodospirillaceae bacterium]